MMPSETCIFSLNESYRNYHVILNYKELKASVFRSEHVSEGYRVRQPQTLLHELVSTYLR